LKIVAIEPSGNLYGSEYCLLDVINGTRARGLRWDVLLPHGEFEKLLLANRIPYHAILPRDAHTLPLLRKIPAYFRARSHITKSKLDVVYLNQAGMLRAVNAMLTGLNVPLICQVQTLEDAEFVAAHPADQERVTTFICNSRFIAGACGAPPEKVSVFYQPVMRSAPAAVVAARRGDTWRIGIVGRIAASKGHWIFLEAAKKLIESGARDVQFVVIGEGIDQKATREFHDAVKESGVSAHFDLRGYRTDIFEELARLHVVTIPSLAEPLGRVLLDASVARRPAIVSASGGLGEFSERFGLGRRVPPGDPASLAEGWKAMLEAYETEVAEFDEAAARTLARLNPKSYSDALSLLISKAAQFRPSRVEWLGDPE
jgi:glycosyltransferase involved in cell wall biosynthesis